MLCELYHNKTYSKNKTNKKKSTIHHLASHKSLLNLMQNEHITVVISNQSVWVLNPILLPISCIILGK